MLNSRTSTTFSTSRSQAQRAVEFCRVTPIRRDTQSFSLVLHGCSPLMWFWPRAPGQQLAPPSPSCSVLTLLFTPSPGLSVGSMDILSHLVQTESHALHLPGARRCLILSPNFLARLISFSRTLTPLLLSACHARRPSRPPGVPIVWAMGHSPGMADDCSCAARHMRG